MDNPVDRTLDLGLVNYVQHPENPNYVVFRFADEKRAETFETRLIEEAIWFEKGDEMKRTRLFYLYGIHKNDYKKVMRINLLTEARHKKKLLPGKYFRIFMILFSFTLIGMAIFGFCDQRRILQEYDTLYNKPLLENKPGDRP